MMKYFLNEKSFGNMILCFNLNVLQEVNVLMFSILFNNVNFIEMIFQISTRGQHGTFVGNPYSLVIGEEGTPLPLLTK